MLCGCVGQILNACSFLSGILNYCLLLQPRKKETEVLFIFNYIDTVDVSM